MSFEITTSRLRIIPLNSDQLKLLLTGTPDLERELGLNPSGKELDEHTHEAMTELYMRAQSVPNAFPWITNWQMILTGQNISIGSACFMDVPDTDGAVELGYGIHPEFRNRGLMTEALRAICDRVLKYPAVRCIHAETEPDNLASQRVLEKCGFIPESATHRILKNHVRHCFRHATAADAPAILALYRSLVGTAFCAWDSSYPSPETLSDDLAHQAIHCLTRDGAIIAVGTIRHCAEHDTLSSWSSLTPCDLMRIGVTPAAQGLGIGSYMLQKLLEVCGQTGYDGMRILVAQTNLPAIKMYRNAGAVDRGTAFSYGIAWFCYEISTQASPRKSAD